MFEVLFKFIEDLLKYSFIIHLAVHLKLTQYH